MPTIDDAVKALEAQLGNLRAHGLTEEQITSSLYDQADFLRDYANRMAAARMQDSDPLVDAVVKKGVKNVDWNTLSTANKDDVLERVANVYVIRGDFENAFAAYELLGTEMRPEKMVLLGDACAAQGNFEQAIACYSQADAQERLVALGQNIMSHPRLREDSLRFAKDAFVAAERKDKLVEVGYAFLGKGSPNHSRECFELADQPEMARFVRDL